jgi:hypothetical protein
VTTFIGIILFVIGMVILLAYSFRDVKQDPPMTREHKAAYLLLIAVYLGFAAMCFK